MVEISGNTLLWLVALGVVAWASKGALGALTDVPLLSNALQILGLVFVAQWLLGTGRAAGDKGLTWQMPTLPALPQVPVVMVSRPSAQE